MNQFEALPPALTDKELKDSLGIIVAQHDENQPISIFGKCHTNMPMIVLFEVNNSSLMLVCPTCGKLVARIAIKKSEVH